MYSLIIGWVIITGMGLALPHNKRTDLRSLIIISISFIYLIGLGMFSTSESEKNKTYVSHKVDIANVTRDRQVGWSAYYVILVGGAFSTNNSYYYLFEKTGHGYRPRQFQAEAVPLFEDTQGEAYLINWYVEVDSGWLKEHLHWLLIDTRPLLISNEIHVPPGGVDKSR